ncbi:hypothetical protein ACIRTB_08965 [Streptomyces sp. NPDC101158]|uniref:hypothetical protein n=1 Tax=Streptomyces sp. NPDC101158 TaxID=3366117 RepID=UPI00381EBAF0
MSRARRLTAALVLTGALIALPACASSVDPIERLGRKAAEKVSPRPHRDRSAPQPTVRPSAEPRPTVSSRPSVPTVVPLVRNHGIRPGVPSQGGAVRVVVRATGS